MFLKMYVIRDVKSDVFLTPFPSATNGSAMRAFSDVVNDTASVINKHPEDYSLYYIGEFCQESGIFQPVVAPVFLESAINFRAGL